MKNKFKLLAGASAAALLVVGLSGTGAQAAKWITGSDVKNGSLTGQDVKNGSLGKQELSPWVQGRLEQAGKAAANGKSGADGKDGKDGVAGKNFEISYAKTFGATTIANIGGSFTTEATEVGTIDGLPAGKYLIQTDALFQNNTATDASPSLQAAVRVDDGTKWGIDAGTVFATFPGATDYEREAQGTTFRVVDLAEGQTLTISAFGYNAEQGHAGSGEFDATISVVVQKVA